MVGAWIPRERFLQEAHAREVSLSGALRTGLDADLRSGDVTGILYGKRKARYRVVWVRYEGREDAGGGTPHVGRRVSLAGTLSEPASTEPSGQTFEHPRD